jgi:hypothetical protein
MENDAVNAAKPDNAIGVGLLYFIVAFLGQILMILGTLIGTIAGTIKAYRTRPQNISTNSKTSNLVLSPKIKSAISS